MNKKVSDFVIRYRFLVIGLIILITLLSLFGIKDIKFSNKMISWLSKKDPRLSLFIKASKDFAINNLVLIMVKPENGEVFSEDFLRKVKLFTEDLKEKKEIYIITSLSNTSDIRKTSDGIEVKDLVEEIPSTKKELENLKKYVLSKENYRGNIVSDDGKWVAFSVFIKDKFDPVAVTGKILIPEAKKIFGESSQILYSGIPSDSYFANKFTIKDMKLLTPIIILLIVLVLYFSFRRWEGVILPALVVIISVVWLFGLLGFLGKPLTIISPAIPVLLVALGSAYGIHIINKYLHTENISELSTLSEATSDIFIPVVLAGITTLVGFMSFISAKLKLIADFGVFSGVGILFALMISLTLIPASYSFVKDEKKPQKKEEKEWFFLKKISEFVVKRRFFVFFFSIILMLLFSLGFLKVKREVNFSEYYPVNSQPRLGQKLVKEKFQGAYPVLFYVESNNVKSSEALRLMRKAENFLYAERELASPFSIVNVIQELNYKLNDEYSLPDEDSSVGNLWFFMEGREELKQIISSDNKKAIVFSKTSESSTGFNKELFRKINNFLKDNFSENYYSYYLKGINFSDEELIREKESEELKTELFGIFKHYGINLQKEQKEKIAILMKTFVLRKESLTSEEKFNLIANYIKSDEFDFDVNEREKRLLLRGVRNLVEKESLNKENIIELFKRILPHDEFDLETARDSSETIFFKLNDFSLRKKVEHFINSLKKIVVFNNPDLEKKLKSVGFDLFDNLAILKAKKVGNLNGKLIDFKIRQTGNPSLITALDESLFSSQVQSLIIAYLVTLFLMIFMRKSIFLGIISTLPILFTVSLMYGFLGFFGIPLDYATMMIGGISIGVGIDYSIHFIHGVVNGLEEKKSLEDAVYEAFSEKGKAILTNTFAVMIGFAVLLFSSMLPLRNFGGTMVGAMFLSAFSTLSLLPSAILIFKIKIKNKEE